MRTTTMRYHEARKLAESFHKDFRPTQRAAYRGNGLETIERLSPETNRPDVLLAVAEWHEHSRRVGARHAIIADALRDAAKSVSVWHAGTSWAYERAA